MRLLWVLLSSCCLPALILAQNLDEERIDYYERWLEQDAALIITPEERQVFESLSTPEEKEKFIEQFWRRRDPAQSTPVNEFKEEHYRRIAYANETYRYGGIPGWKTDRGRVYVKFGPPDNIEAHPHGGPYTRPMREGGGSTWTFPFEIWRYRHIQNVGDDIEIEFVDPSFSGEYRMSLRPEEKDALLHAPKLGPTFFETMGVTGKADRPYFTPGNTYDRTYMGGKFRGSRDMPFARMEQYFSLQRPPEIKFGDLKSVVLTEISYEQLPFLLRQDFIQLHEEKYLAPVTIEIQHHNLTFRESHNFMHAAVNVYGLVTGLAGQIVAEFEDTLNKEYTADRFSAGQKARSVYQKMLMLEPGVYKLSLILKDVNSGSIGTLQRRISIPNQRSDRLSTSSLILTRQIHKLAAPPESAEQFVLGDLKVIPNVSKRFYPQELLGVYLQVYGSAFDQSSQEPALSPRYTILDGRGTVIQEEQDLAAESVQFYSEQRVVLVKAIHLDHLEPGEYKLQVSLSDRISGQRAEAEDTFSILSSPSEPRP